jgi:NADPH-dependent glutamate synthase beta subunit-like oxidoreductase/Pyruvate/2-oxoacid:ferredoxin oxidoreductase delta subunit
MQESSPKTSGGPLRIGKEPDPEFSLNYIHPQQMESVPPCGANCPSGGNVREWIGLVAQRDKLGLTKYEAYKYAWETIVDRNPFPATMGRICPHPCENECNRIAKDGAVAVNELERFLGDWGIDQALPLRKLDFRDRSEKIAVIGAGPAGLSFAYQMARRGYAVTVYDRHEKAGGMLRFGIPDYRLPPAVLDAEIQRIEELGVSFELGIRVGRNISVDQLREAFDVVFVGVGAQIGRSLGIPGESGPGVYSGAEYLHRINTGERIDTGAEVIVVGGGNTAIDAARAARRQRANVTILYRRTRHEMPAIEHEIDEAIEEGVQIEFLASPVEIQRDQGVVGSIRVQRMELGEEDESGRRRPVPVAGSTFELPATAVMVAISQEPDWEAIEALKEDGPWLQPRSDGTVDLSTYAGGDVRGLGIASMAIGHGRAAAETAHARLVGLQAPVPGEVPPRNQEAAVKLDFYEGKPRVSAPETPVEQRLKDATLQTAQTISEDAFLQEASRCLSCENCFGCRHCWMYCNAAGFTEVDDPRPGHYFKLDLSVCEGCGKCIDVCPCGYLKPQVEA